MPLVLPAELHRDIDGIVIDDQIAALVKKIEPAADIVRSVMEEAEPILKGASRWTE